MRIFKCFVILKLSQFFFLTSKSSSEAMKYAPTVKISSDCFSSQTKNVIDNFKKLRLRAIPLRYNIYIYIYIYIYVYVYLINNP